MLQYNSYDRAVYKEATSKAAPWNTLYNNYICIKANKGTGVLPAAAARGAAMAAAAAMYAAATAAAAARGAAMAAAAAAAAAMCAAATATAAARGAAMAAAAAAAMHAAATATADYPGPRVTACTSKDEAPPVPQQHDIWNWAAAAGAISPTSAAVPVPARSNVSCSTSRAPYCPHPTGKASRAALCPNHTSTAPGAAMAAAAAAGIYAAAKAKGEAAAARGAAAAAAHPCTISSTWLLQTHGTCLG